MRYIIITNSRIGAWVRIIAGSGLMIMLGCKSSTENPELLKVYVTLQKADKVAVVDGLSGEVLKQVDVDLVPGTMDSPHYLVLDELNGFWYVSLITSGFVLKFDLYTDELLDSLQVGNQPALMALDPVQQRLYVSRFMPLPGQSPSDSREIQQIDTRTMTVLAAVDVGADSPHGIALNAAGDTLWVASIQASHFFRIAVNRFGEAGYQPESFKIDPGVPDNYGINDGLYEPLEIELSPDGELLYITCSDVEVNELRAYSTADGSLQSSYDTGLRPWHMIAASAGQTVYVTNNLGNSVSAIDLAARSGVGTITDTSFHTPHGIAVTGDGQYLFVTSSAAAGELDSYLHQIDAAQGKVIRSTWLGRDVMATGLAVMSSPCVNCD